MNKVPERYKNVINPWQTPREITSAIKNIERMLKKLKLTPAEEDEILCQKLKVDWSVKK